MPDAIRKGVLAADAPEKEARLARGHRGSLARDAPQNVQDVNATVGGAPSRRLSTKTTLPPAGGASAAGGSPGGPPQKRARLGAASSPVGGLPGDRRLGDDAVAQPPPDDRRSGQGAGVLRPPRASATSPAPGSQSAGGASAAASAPPPGSGAPGVSSAQHAGVAAGTAAALAAVAVGAGVAGSARLPQKRATMESVDRSERAAGAAEKRRQAERARGLGPDAVAQLDQQMSSGPAPSPGECAEHFGYNSRDRLRRELEKSRRDGTGKQTSPQFCAKHMHVCSSDQDRGCRSCFRACHLDCRSESVVPEAAA